MDGVFTHLAIVENPRYERANIVFNSKTVVQNFDPNQKRDEKGQWTKDDAAIQKKKDSLTPIEVKPEEVPKFKTKEELGEWFSGIFKDLGSVTIEDTGIRIDLYGGNAEREAFKRRLQQEPNKAVAKAFEDVVTKSVKVDERQKDERHKHNQEIYYNKLKLGKDFYDVNLFVDYLEPNKEYRYAGHSTTKVDNKISTRDTQVINHIMLTKVDVLKTGTNNVIASIAMETLKPSDNIITDIQEDFNPGMKNNEVQNWNEADHPRDEAGKFTEKGKAARKTQANYGRKVRLKEGDKTGIIIGSVPHGDDPDTGEEMFLYEIKWDNGGIERIHSNKVDLTIDLKELEKEIDDNLQSWMTPRNLERIKKQKSSQESKGWTREEMEDYYRSSIAGDDFAKKWEYAKVHPWKDLTKAQNNKEQDMALLDELKNLITKVENDKGENMDDKEKVENEKVDKRKLIDEVAGIMKGAGADDEKIRTAIAKMEKLKCYICGK